MLYTLVDHRNNVNMVKTQVEPRDLGNVFNTLFSVSSKLNNLQPHLRNSHLFVSSLERLVYRDYKYSSNHAKLPRTCWKNASDARWFSEIP